MDIEWTLLGIIVIVNLAWAIWKYKKEADG